MKTINLYLALTILCLGCIRTTARKDYRMLEAPTSNVNYSLEKKYISTFLREALKWAESNDVLAL